MQLALRSIPSDLFFYHADIREFSQELSSLGNYRRRLEQRIFDDACDVGFAIRSTKTGVEKIFTLSKTLTSGPGQIDGWEFIEMGKGGRSVLAPIKVIVYND